LKRQISVEELRTRKIFIATPMYGGQCHGMFTKACVDLGMMASKYGVDIKFFYLFNESLITRARNYLVDEFLRSEYTHLMFIDSDVSFNPSDVLALAALADPKSNMDVVCGPYPKKCIAWERIAHAVKEGFADENPANLEQYVGDFVFNPAMGATEIRINEPVEVLESGTGFMMIQRPALEKYRDAYPEFEYMPDHNRSVHFDGKRMIHAFFDTVIDDETKRYLSEDYMFCQWARKIGLKVWLCPWMKTIHIGTFNFGGSLEAIAQLPGATHGGLQEQEAAKQFIPGKVLPPAPSPPPIVPIPSSIVPSETTKNRAERRREEMKKRRAARKKKKASTNKSKK
jgi:hypothetical protein